MEYFLYVMELIGTVAFAISGAMVGIKKSMDLFGICTLGLATACGGGLLRDILLGKLPPAMFCESIYALTAIGVSLLTFIFIARRVKTRHTHFFEGFLRIADALGLGIFTVVGVAAVMHNGFGDNFFFTVFLGTMTGVGGGLLRDMMAQEAPYIFVRHIYACASIAGAIICRLLWSLWGENVAMLIGAAVVIGVRLLAAHFRWSLPRIRGDQHNAC